MKKKYNEERFKLVRLEPDTEFNKQTGKLEIICSCGDHIVYSVNGFEKVGIRCGCGTLYRIERYFTAPVERE